MPAGLAQRLSAIAPSATLAMAAKAAELRSRGIDVVGFSVGEPDFEPPRAVLEAAKAAIDRGASKYTAVTGIPELRAAICESSARRRGYKPTPAEVCVSVGAKHALFNLAVALYEPGDEVILPTPAWVSYPEQIRMMGATPVIVPTTEAAGWRVAPDDLARALTPRTKAIILCTPSNPTGAAYSEAELHVVIEVLRKSDCYIIVDEIYAELVYDGFKQVSVATLAPDLRERIIIVDGVAKTYAMTGWRIGWTIAQKSLIKAMDTVQGQSTTNATAVAQWAALAALTGPQEEVVAMRDTFQKRRDVMIEGLNSIPGMHCRVPEGAFYAFASCRGLYGIEHEGRVLQTDDDVAMFFLERAHVATVAGGPFGAPGYIRLSYATNEDRIKAGIEALRTAVTSATRRAHDVHAAT